MIQALSPSTNGTQLKKGERESWCSFLSFSLLEGSSTGFPDVNIRGDEKSTGPNSQLFLLHQQQMQMCSGENHLYHWPGIMNEAAKSQDFDEF